MIEKTLFCKENENRVKRLIIKICEGLNRDGLLNDIKIDTIILSECFISAKTSIGFYNIENEEVSHYKEIAHVAYWISRFKPIRITNPFHFLESLKEIGVDISKQFDFLKVSEETINHGLELPINEYVAFFLATDYIRMCQLSEIEEQPQTSQEGLRKRVDEINQKIGVMKNSIISSMRYHNYSTRGFAFMLESLMRIDEI